tara:strand:+ start:278 stop:1222 length:945 start_codon:yes stop_codon:yes gene_type:complete
MAAFSAANAQTITTQANYIPEMWSDEIIGAFKANLVLANLVTKIMHNGKKGDTVHIPSQARGSASVKAAGNNAVTLITDTAGVVDIAINKHFEYSRLIEDMAEVQALDSYRKFYTDDAGFALAKQVDTDLHNLGEGLQSGATTDDTYAAAVIGSDGATTFLDASTGNAAAISDAGLRKVIQTLDDADVPLSERYLIIPPVEKKSLMGLSRFTEQAFVGEGGPSNTIRNGYLGDVYGVPIYVSTNVDSITCDDTSTVVKSCLLLHRSALGYVEQMGIRSQNQYMQEYLSDLFTADTIYGVGELRNDAGMAIIVPS